MERKYDTYDEVVILAVEKIVSGHFPTYIILNFIKSCSFRMSCRKSPKNVIEVLEATVTYLQKP